ncbi:MAG: hypothetical protein KGD63_03945 [Candidatus Lokiarchaeota archaeon]|nr:hypothetical protein [Candidatus Lokiarchaeota archaeon]
MSKIILVSTNPLPLGSGSSTLLFIIKFFFFRKEQSINKEFFIIHLKIFLVFVKMTIIIPKKVYLTIVAAAVRYANKRISDDDWLEVYGVFIGKNEGNNVIISQAYPITHQVKNPEDVIDKVYWSNEDYESFSIIDDAAFSRGEFTVGWWHSHPGFKVMMSQLDVKTTLSYQQFNPQAISLVFNPDRLIRQIELPDKKGNPVIQLKSDPGFKIYRLDDVNRGIEASYHENDYIIQGYENMEQCIKLTQKFVIEITNLFPNKDIYKIYEKYINEKVNDLNSRLIGTEEYLITLVRKGEKQRTQEVLETQTKEIRKFAATTYMKIEMIKEFLDYLEYKERDIVIPKVKEILSKWDDLTINLENKFQELENKF